MSMIGKEGITAMLAEQWAANQLLDVEKTVQDLLMIANSQQEEIRELEKEVKRLKKIVRGRPCQLCDIGDFRAPCTCKEKE